MNKTTEICVATHKKLNVSFPEPYHLIQVNCANTGEHWEGYLHDDEGKNISAKNPFYSELTALYWLWKNSQADIKGLVHYRRFFSRRTEPDVRATCLCGSDVLDRALLSGREIERFLSEEGCEALLIMPQRPWPRTGREELLQFVYEKDLDALERVIREDFPDYAEALETVLAAKHLSYFNMLIARAELFDAYCAWLFAVLGEVEARVDITSYDAQNKRLFGSLSEVLLNVFMEKRAPGRRYFQLLQTYRDRGVGEEAERKLLRRERRGEELKKLHLGGLLGCYHRLLHPEAYAQLVSTKEYLSELSERGLLRQEPDQAR